MVSAAGSPGPGPAAPGPGPGNSRVTPAGGSARTQAVSALTTLNAAVVPPSAATDMIIPVSYTHLRAHETVLDL
eukprot:290789-Hanusia_phi.AAC.1